MPVRNQTTEGGVRFLKTTAEGMYLFPPHSDFLETHVQPAQINPFVSDGATQTYPLGTELWYNDRKFRYAKSGGVALTVGTLCQSTVPLAGHITEAIGEPAIGDTTIAFTPNTVTTDDIVANGLADGHIHINDGTSQGYMYRIKSHPALTGGASGTLTLYDPIVVAPAAASTATVTYHHLYKLLIHDSPPTAKVAGVAVCAVPANEFCWVQFQGPCAVLTQGTLIIADFCVPSATVDGAVMPSAAVETDGPMVGHVMAVNVDGDYSAIWLALP